MIVQMLHSAFWIVSERRSTTPHSFARLPSISMPRSGATEGSSIEQMNATKIGKMIFSAFETSRSCVILILRSFSVVSAFMIGGWISGISAM